MAAFPARVKELRIKKGLSQPQLAEAIGLTKQTISLWERGISKPEFETMDRLADFFGVNMGYLLGEKDDPGVYEPTDADAEAWVNQEEIQEVENVSRQFSQLSAETRQMVAAMIHEAYRIDRISGRLTDGFEIVVKRSKK
jgi:transcriptional regulator with XRE-family HTH domain